jgi:hypothetical protein
MKETIMRAQGLSTAGWMHRRVGPTRETTRWYRPLQHWWTTRQIARREAHLAALAARWDAAHEAVTPRRAEAALEMAVAQGALAIATQPYGFAF